LALIPRNCDADIADDGYQCDHQRVLDETLTVVILEER
jgi:hypothetical protein